jgi:hypothetical protein
MALPDVELVLLAALRVKFPTANFGTMIPADMVDRMPFVTVKRIASPQLHPKLATRCRVDVSVWHTNRKSGADLARNIAAFLTTETTVVSHCVATTEPFELRPGVFQEGAQLPQDNYRFQATYRLVVRAS